jgi:hypothetical protein
MLRAVRAHVLALVLCLVSLPAWAQRALTEPAAVRWRTAVRADAFVDRDPGAQLAVGLAIPAAYNVRLAADVGIGGVSRDQGWKTAGRIDLLARWLSDPFRQSRWGLNAGGGVGLRVEERAVPRIVAILTLGLEGPGNGSWVPGIEVGVGGGARAGLTLRRASKRRR